jgi:uncharacterized protein (TIGR03437 family)
MDFRTRAGILAVLAACGAVLRADDSRRGAAPAYSESGIVDSAGFTAGALAPYSLATIYGSGLSFGSAAAPAAADLPYSLAGVQVIVAGVYAAQLFYVSESQINLLVPNSLRPGPVTIRVARQGVAGPDVAVTLFEASPALFRTPSGFVIATHADNSAADEASPAKPGEVVVLYAAGLGRTSPELPDRGAPSVAAQIRRKDDLQLLLNGAAVDSKRILYAGITPGWPGLYQINVSLPEDAGPDPEVRIVIGERTSASGLKLAVRPDETGARPPASTETGAAGEPLARYP